MMDQQKHRLTIMMMVRFIGLFMLLSLVVPAAEAFVWGGVHHQKVTTTTVTSRHPRSSFPFCTTRIPSPSAAAAAAASPLVVARVLPLLRAVIYMPDGQVVVDDDDDQGDSAATTTTTTSLLPRPEWVESVSYQHAAVLARLAVAFAPSNQRLGLEQIQNIQVLGVDETHMEIEVVVVSGYELVALTVSVPFLRPCRVDDEYMEECVLQNLQELDDNEEVQGRIQLVDLFREVEQEWETREPMLPSWWAHPSPGETESDCVLLRQLLNEPEQGFEQDLCSLASCSLAFAQEQQQQQDTQPKFDKAKVLAVGPLGLIVRALSRGTRLQNTTTTTTPRAAANFMDVPIRFPVAATTSGEVREFVLTALEAASAYAEQERAAAAAAAAAATATPPISESVAETERTHLVLEKEEIMTKSAAATSSPTRDYLDIEDLGERAFQILLDLGMVEVHLDPSSDPNYDHRLDDEVAPNQICKK